MITTVLRYSAASGSDGTVYDTPCRVDMGNVGVNLLGHEEQTQRASVALPENVPVAGLARPRSQYEAAYNPVVWYLRIGERDEVSFVFSTYIL